MMHLGTIALWMTVVVGGFFCLILLAAAIDHFRP